MELPEWIRIKPFPREKYVSTLKALEGQNTVCMAANCPNRYECFSHKTATFLIMGDICTRNCLYCNIRHGVPGPLDRLEPGRVARAIKRLGLEYAVITSVTRDDLPDGGAGHFAETARQAGCRVELLIPELKNPYLRQVLAGPDVINHNIEVAGRLFPRLRPQGGYARSLRLLRQVKELAPAMTTKSGLMAGLGESTEELLETIKDIRDTGCDILTIGQYLQPSPEHAEAVRYYTPEEFAVLRKKALRMGFMHVESGPMVRSSYRAAKIRKTY